MTARSSISKHCQARWGLTRLMSGVETIDAIIFFFFFARSPFQSSVGFLYICYKFKVDCVLKVKACSRLKVAHAEWFVLH